MRRLLNPFVLMLAAVALAACGAEETGTATGDADAQEAVREAQSLADQVRDSAQRLADTARDRAGDLDPQARAQVEEELGRLETDAQALTDQARELPAEVGARGEIEQAAEEVRAGAQDLQRALEDGQADPQEAVRDNLDSIRADLTAAVDQLQADAPGDVRAQLDELRRDIAALTVDDLEAAAAQLDTPEGVAQEVEAVTRELERTVRDLPADPQAALQEHGDRLSELERRAQDARQAVDELPDEAAAREELRRASEAAEQAVADARSRLEAEQSVTVEDLEPQISQAREQLASAVEELAAGVPPEAREQLDDVRERLERELGAVGG